MESWGSKCLPKVEPRSAFIMFRTPSSFEAITEHNKQPIQLICFQKFLWYSAGIKGLNEKNHSQHKTYYTLPLLFISPCDTWWVFLSIPIGYYRKQMKIYIFLFNIYFILKKNQLGCFTSLEWAVPKISPRNRH